MAEKKGIVDMAYNVTSQIFRQYSSLKVAPLPGTEISHSGILQNLGLTWIPNFAPVFYLSSNHIKILHDPHSFYNLLLQEISKAKKRIVLSSLYLGTGVLEKNLVGTLQKSLNDKPGLKVKILLDCTRGSRGKVNSRKMVLPLLRSHGNSCKVSLYQNSFLQKPLISFMPTKYKEIIGLQHIKVYLFDDNFIITGANLSHDYFTNRQDRYMLIQNNKELADFIEGLVDKVSEFSFQLNADDNLTLSETWPHHPVKTESSTFNFAASTLIRNYYESFVGNTRSGENDTVIFPLLEMGPFNIHYDSIVTKKLLEKCNESNTIDLTTGYFNLTNAYINSIINCSKGNFEIMMAHPTANGFYQAKGPAGGIPHAYTYIASIFHQKIIANNQSHRINMFEYKRPEWTYHAKGLWLSTIQQELPFLTMIGSPNFGERSVKHDLECQFLIATTNEKLQYDLLQEKKQLYNFSSSFTKETCEQPDRVTPLWVKVIVGLFRSYL